MTALIIAAAVLVFVSWKAAKLAVIAALIALAVCTRLATAIAIAAGKVLALGLPRAVR